MQARSNTGVSFVHENVRGTPRDGVATATERVHTRNGVDDEILTESIRPTVRC